MATNISPGVYTKIIDLSHYLSEIPGSVGYIPFLSRRGPDNKLIYSADRDTHARMFGRPNINDYGKSYGQGTYMAWNHISVAPSLYCIRVLPDDATYSNLYVNFDDTSGSEAITITNETSVNSLAELKTHMAVSGNINPMFVFYPVGRGDSYDDFAVTMTEHANPNLIDDIYIIDVWETQFDGDDVIVESFEISLQQNVVDSAGDSLWIEDVINKFSNWIRVYVDETNLNTWQANPIELVVGTSTTPIHLTNGSEGSLVTIDSQTGKRTVDTTVASQILSEAYTGLLTNPETSLLEDDILDLDSVYFSLVWDGGYPTSVKTSIFTLVNDMRLDCIAITDNGDNVSVTASLAARTNDHTWNSKYMAIYEPYNKIPDVHTGKEIWVSPVFHAASLIPLNDKLYELWYPFGGVNRTSIGIIKELRFNPKLGQRDSLYLKQINPIVKFSMGYSINSELTSQTRPSSLQDVHVIRMVLYIKRAIEQFAKYYIFEFNDAGAWDSIAAEVNSFLQRIQSARGLESFSVDVGADEYERKRKICHINIELYPMKAIEKIELNLYIK